MSGPDNAARAVLGGVEFAVGGWGAYELERRRARAVFGGGWGDVYGGRTRVGAEDVVRSVDAARARGALGRAALALAEQLGRLEDQLCAPDEDGVWECGRATLAAPAVTSADLRDFAADPAQRTDPEAIYRLSEDVAAYAEAFGVDVAVVPPARRGAALPPLPTRAVPVSDDTAVARLEAATAPRIAAIEGLQAALATQLSAAAAGLAARASAKRGGAAPRDPKLNKRAASPPPETRAPPATRGAEIDAAPPPTAALRVGLQADGAFDIRDDAVVPTEPLDGLYFGVYGADSPSRTTLLTPVAVARCAIWTSGRMYAWVVLDSPEGRFALRATPGRSRALALDPDKIVAWLRPRLTGDPPHKVDLEAYLAHLRGLGLEILEAAPGGEAAPVRGAVARFDLAGMTTAAERDDALAALRALGRADFEALDWAQYDAAAGRLACREPNEVAGDVVIDLERRTVTAPKVRTGTMWGVRPHLRAYVTFHTHPAARYHGSRAEPPSEADLLVTLDACAFDLQAWAFVSAPEGTYILRPGEGLVRLYKAAPQEVADVVRDVYKERLDAGLGSAEAGVRDAVAALREVGFVAFLRAAPCLPLLATPDLFPEWNRESREANRQAFAALAAAPGADVARLDWAPIEAAAAAPTLAARTWLTATADPARGAAALPSGQGHMMRDLADPRAYPSGIPGPLFVVYFPDEVPELVPHAAIEVARHNAATWAWTVFLGPRRVTVFRAAADGVEIHGPVARVAEAAARVPEADGAARRRQP